MLLHHVTQKLVSRPLRQIRDEVFTQLSNAALQVPQGEVALTVGSRGISSLPEIIRACGDWLKEQGASPFLVPCMGSHNGATGSGQQAMIESLGITEAAMEMPIRASMEVVQIGEVSTGPVFMDRHCHESAGVLVINRVKLHTCFAGPIQSGLTKMMVVGMGKIRSAQTFHSSGAAGMKEMLLEMGQYVLDSGRILGGLAILEDGYDQTAELHAIPPEQILSREADLLIHHQSYFPRLPVDDLNVLIVGSMGKTWSGTGMDTNVIGRRGIRGFEDVLTPRIRVIGVLSLAEASKGNALGVGNADFITQRLRDAIDEQKTLINTLTTGDMERAKIPATLESDQVLIETVRERYGDQRWMFIPNTLQLDHLYVSPDLVPELQQQPSCEVAPVGLPLVYDAGRIQLRFRDH